MSRVTRSSSSARSESAVATPSSSTKLPRSLTRSRWMRTLCHSSRWRSFSTTASVPRLASSASHSAARVVDGHEPVAALARLVGVDAVVLDERGAAGLLLAQLQAPGVDPEVRVALVQDAAVARAQTEHDGQRALGVRVGRLELDVAARRSHLMHDTSTFRAMEGVTVVDHVLLRRLLSILRDKRTTHRVFRETMTDAALILGYEAMRGLRGAEIEVQTPLETRAGRAAGRRGVRRRDPARRARARRRVPAARAGGARRPPRACTATRRRCGRSVTTRTSRRAWRTPRCSSSTRCWPPAARACRRSRG